MSTSADINDIEEGLKFQPKFDASGLVTCVATDAVTCAVLIEAEHTCMSVRGVAKHGASTFTSRYTGMFRDNPAEQARFLSMVRGMQR